MTAYWEKAPFHNNYGGLLKNNLKTNLPFSIGAITRQGFDHIHNGISNQDAINFIIEDELIIGVLCDGCTSNHSKNLNSFSQNQVGANLITQMVLNLSYQNIIPRKNKMNLEKFRRWLTRETQQRLGMILKATKIKTPQELNFVCNNLLATVVGFVIRKKEYFIFHCGDGLVKINDDTYDLSFDSGNYLSSLEAINKNTSFKIITRGLTKDLKSICVTSDGFKSHSILDSDVFNDVYKRKTINSGVIDFIPEFHGEVLEDCFSQAKTTNQWPNDDASLILIRRKK